MEKQAFKRKPVESSNIASIGHSFPRRMLEVEFNNGSIYRYKGVNNKTYRALLSAESKGKAFHRLIKGKYPYRKLVSKDDENANESYKEANIVNYEEMVKSAYEEIMGFNKEAWSIADDPNLAAILDSAQKSESKNTSAPKVKVPKMNIPDDIAVIRDTKKTTSTKLPKNFKRYGTIGAATLAGALAVAPTAKAVRNKKRKNQETAENNK